MTALVYSIPKPVRELDSAYLSYVRKQPCCVSGRTPVDAHHVGRGGVGTKPSDRMAIPLHRDYHREFHDFGLAAFEAKYQINCAEIVLKLNRGYRAPKPRKVAKPSVLEVRCSCGKRHSRGLQIIKQSVRFWCTTTREYRSAQ